MVVWGSSNPSCNVIAQMSGMTHESIGKAQAGQNELAEIYFVDVRKLVYRGRFDPVLHIYIAIFHW